MFSKCCQKCLWKNAYIFTSKNLLILKLETRFKQILTIILKQLTLSNKKLIKYSYSIWISNKSQVYPNLTPKTFFSTVNYAENHTIVKKKQKNGLKFKRSKLRVSMILWIEFVRTLQNYLNQIQKMMTKTCIRTTLYHAPGTR